MTYAINRNDRFGSFEISFDVKPSDAVRGALKAFRFRWHGVKKVWYGFASDEDALRTAIDGADKGAPVVKAPDLRAEYQARLEASGLRADWIDFKMKDAGTIVKLSNGDLVVIEKPRIETRFCFGESGYDADEAFAMADKARKDREYFKSENLAGLKGWIDLLSWKDIPWWKRVFVIRNGNGIADVYWDNISRMDENNLPEEISDADRALMLEGYKTAYAAFEKRLDTYLKRYGLSKVHSWTYWRDA